MGEKSIYFLFTNTGTHLSRVIKYYTKENLNHVSIGFDNDLLEVYSFGRKRPKNPFIGGFIREDTRSDFLKNSDCALYEFRLSGEDYTIILQNIKKIEAEKGVYRYNFIGLLGVLFQIRIERKYAYFCSQFVATVIQGTNSFKLSKPIYLITPADIRNLVGMDLIFQGKLGDYHNQEMDLNERIILRAIL